MHPFMSDFEKELSHCMICDRTSVDNVAYTCNTSMAFSGENCFIMLTLDYIILYQ